MQAWSQSNQNLVEMVGASVRLLPETSSDEVKFSFRAWDILTRKEKEHRLLVAGGL